MKEAAQLKKAKEAQQKKAEEEESDEDNNPTENNENKNAGGKDDDSMETNKNASPGGTPVAKIVAKSDDAIKVLIAHFHINPGPYSKLSLSRFAMHFWFCLTLSLQIPSTKYTDSSLKDVVERDDVGEIDIHKKNVPGQFFCLASWTGSQQVPHDGISVEAGFFHVATNRVYASCKWSQLRSSGYSLQVCLWTIHWAGIPRHQAICKRSQRQQVHQPAQRNPIQFSQFCLRSFLQMLTWYM